MPLMTLGRLRDILGFDDFAADLLMAAPSEMSPSLAGQEHVEPPQSRAAALLYLGSFLSIVLFAIVANYFGNGTNLLPSPGFPSNCDRAWKTRRLEDLARSTSPPRALILGSSRVHAFEPELVERLTSLRCFNFGVSVGCPIDFLAMLRLAVRIGINPELVVLGIDETSFGDNSSNDYYDLQLVSQPSLFREVPLHEQAQLMARALKTITVSSTKTSLMNLMGRLPTTSGQRSMTEIYFDDGLGKLYVHETERPDHARRLVAGIEEKVKFWGHFYGPYEVERLRPQSPRTDCFRDLLRLAHERGIVVHVVLLPVHPEFERGVFSPRFLEIRKEVSELLRSVCFEFGADYRDFTSLAAFGGDPNDFFDGTHLTVASARKIISAILVQR